MTLLLAVLNAGALCVAHTDICAPPSSTVSGQITDEGGSVTIKPATAMKALGAEFRSGALLEVFVRPWSDGKTRGFHVVVSGELAGESVISGATVAGAVRIEQLQGGPGGPQLLQAAELKRGSLQVLGVGTIDVGPGMSVFGSLEAGGGRFEVRSTKPFRAFGLGFTGSTVSLLKTAVGSTIRGELASAQEIGGVLVTGPVDVVMTAGRARLATATLARATPLQTFGLPTGTAPPGTTISINPNGATTLTGATPVLVCGVPVTPDATTRAVSFFPQPGKRVGVRATISGADVEVQPGLHLTGAFTATYDAACQAHAIDGTLARAHTRDGVTLAAATPIALAEAERNRVIRGTIGAPVVVDGMSLLGAATLLVTPAGDKHVIDGIVAKPTTFQQWQVPTGTHVQPANRDAWMFEVPPSTSATAVGAYRGERIDHVMRAQASASSTSFALARPHTPAGATIGFKSVTIVHKSGCLTGEVAGAQKAGPFSIPVGASVTVCGGAIVGVQGATSVPSLAVGRAFATMAVAGGAKSTPPGTVAYPLQSGPSGPIAGYWIQINSLCHAPTGIPTPPPPQRWIWVDTAGQAPDAADRTLLARVAAKPGKPCPVVPCCPP